MTAQDWFIKGMDRLKTFSVQGLLPALRVANEGAIEDIMNPNGNAYYQWSTCLVDVMKPKQVVELGGAMGVWDLCVLHYLPEDSRLYSITLEEGGLEFSYVVDTYKNFVPVIGNDLDLTMWPKDLDLAKTDLWFFDSNHTPEQINKEMELYSPYFRKGTIVLLDDIHINPSFEKACEEIKNGKYTPLDWFDVTDPLHWSGFAVSMVL